MLANEGVDFGDGDMVGAVGQDAAVLGSRLTTSSTVLRTTGEGAEHREVPFKKVTLNTAAHNTRLAY
jgi:hypothetical protein